RRGYTGSRSAKGPWEEEAVECRAGESAAGRTRPERQEGWGAKVIDRLGDELRRAFPAMKGLSPRNIKYMRSLAEAFPDRAFVQEVLAQITWYHAITVVEKVKEPSVREWHVRKAIARCSRPGWS